MPKRAVFKRSRRELALDVSAGVHILLIVEQSSLESQSRECAKTSILTAFICGLDPTAPVLCMVILLSFALVPCVVYGSNNVPGGKRSR